MVSRVVTETVDGRLAVIEAGYGKDKRGHPLVELTLGCPWFLLNILPAGGDFYISSIALYF